jgi:hypothetical protein
VSYRVSLSLLLDSSASKCIYLLFWFFVKEEVSTWYFYLSVLPSSIPSMKERNRERERERERDRDRERKRGREGGREEDMYQGNP